MLLMAYICEEFSQKTTDLNAYSVWFNSSREVSSKAAEGNRLYLEDSSVINIHLESVLLKILSEISLDDYGD